MGKANRQNCIALKAFLIALISPVVTTGINQNKVTAVKSVQIEQQLDKIKKQLPMSDTFKSEYY